MIKGIEVPESIAALRPIIQVITVALSSIFIASLAICYFGHMEYSHALALTLSFFTHVELHELLEAPAAFRIILSLVAIGGYFVLLYLIYVMLIFVFEGKFGKMMEEAKMEKKLSKLNKHVIVCGGGRVGSAAAHVLKKQGVPLVVIENNGGRIDELTAEKITVLRGDALKEETLKKARIDKAIGLVSAMGADPDNIFLSIIALGLNPDLKLVVRAHSEDSVKIIKHGISAHVIIPEVMGGQHLAQELLKDVGV